MEVNNGECSDYRFIIVRGVIIMKIIGVSRIPARAVQSSELCICTYSIQPVGALLVRNLLESSRKLLKIRSVVVHKLIFFPWKAQDQQPAPNGLRSWLQSKRGIPLFATDQA
jgi:hypothetical protein